MKLHKRLAFALMPLLLCGAAVAKPVDPATAIGVASRILKGAELRASLLTSEIYLVTPVDDAGYVLVSADDCAIPVLAYSESNAFVADGIPAHMQDWLDGYSREIASLVASGVGQSTEVAAMWNGSASSPKDMAASVAPLMTTRWNQNPRYNNLCPSGSGGTAVAGCVAIATAQVMKYWNHPQSGHGSHSYNCAPYGTLSANFDTVYQWHQMPDALGWGSSNAQISAVATLVYHVGVAVNMDYSPSSSGAHVLAAGVGHSTQSALPMYFKYSPRLRGVYKSQYTDDQWDSIIMYEINHGRPVIYVGRDMSVGHAFVLDGYNSNVNASGRRYFNVNWGWGGYNDGYYTIGNLAPGGGGAGGGSYVFNFNNSALVGIEPAYNTQGDSVAVVSVTSADGTMGHVTGSGLYTPYTDSIRVMAVAAHGYRFAGWSSGYIYNPVDFVTSGDYTDTAFFEPISGDTIGYVNNILLGSLNTSPTDTVEWAIRIPASLRNTSRSITGIQFYPYGGGRYFINVYQGDTIMPANRIYSKYIMIGGQTWQTVMFDSAVAVDNTRPLWVVLRNNGNDYIYPVAYGPYSGNRDGSWIRRGGHWTINDTAAWLIRAILEPRGERQCAVEVAMKYFDDTLDIELPAECAVSGGGLYAEGTTATITATDGGGMHFRYWVTPFADTIYHSTHTFAVDYPVAFTAVYGPAVSIVGAEMPPLRVSVDGRQVTVDVPEGTDVRAYDLQGRQVASGLRFSLHAAGVYVVRADGAIRKIVVQ